MVREFFQVPILMFQLGPAPRMFRNTNVNTDEAKYSDRNCNLSHAVFGFCFKPGEVHSESSSGNRARRGNDKFVEDVSIFSTRRGLKNLEAVSGYSCKRSGDRTRTNKFVRSYCVNNLRRNFRSGCKRTVINYLKMKRYLANLSSDPQLNHKI